MNFQKFIFAESGTAIARNNPNSCMYEEKNSTTESSVPAEDKNMSKELHNLDYVNAAPDENYDSNRTNNSGNSYLFLSFFTLFVSNFALFITH